jgi:hypothetical protein
VTRPSPLEQTSEEQQQQLLLEEEEGGGKSAEQKDEDPTSTHNNNHHSQQMPRQHQPQPFPLPLRRRSSTTTSNANNHNNNGNNNNNNHHHHHSPGDSPGNRHSMPRLSITSLGSAAKTFRTLAAFIVPEEAADRERQRELRRAANQRRRASLALAIVEGEGGYKNGDKMKGKNDEELKKDDNSGWGRIKRAAIGRR